MKNMSFMLLVGALVLALCVAPVVAVSAGSPNSGGFMTGGGKVVDSNGSVWTCSGKVSFNEDGTGSVNFGIVDHASGVAWRCNEDLSGIVSELVGDDTNKPKAGFDRVTFTGNFTGNNGETATLMVVITDNGEPGNGSDTIVVSGDFSFGGTLCGGNFQAHKGSYAGPPPN